MMDLTDKSQLIKFLKKNNLWAKKGLSQNFLVDKSALEKIVEAGELTPPPAPPQKGGELVVEIGPGLGVLTRELVDKAKEVIAIEADEKLATLLVQQYSTSNIQHSLNVQSDQLSNGCSMEVGSCKLNIINADILKLNLNEIIGDRRYKVVANIPYHITSKILELFLSGENKPEMMVLLVQKEVAERVCAKPGEMSVLAVSVQLYGEPEIIGIVPKESFFPSPKVDSAILRISNIQDPFDSLSLTQDDTTSLSKEFFRCVKIGFASRRKTLINNLSAGYRLDKKEIEDIINSIGLGENVRAQELSIEEWKKLSDKLT